MGKKTLWASVLALFIVLAFFEFTNTDLLIQEHLYLSAEKTWVLKDPKLLYRAIFYTGIKIPIFIIGFGALAASLISWRKKKWNEYRKGLIIISLSLIILPLSVAVIGKNFTNVQCPDDLNHFAGKIPYVKLFDNYPVNPNSPDGKFPRGHCFPAGHASGGFALLALVCFFKEKRNKILAFIFAMSTGWIMGVYQMLRGAHFLSHHLVTMILALILVSTLNLLIKDFSNESTQTKK
ncbi:MAG: phosphatase PAP2 family protein [Bacteriovorax sp.]|nr:phosphatase PAP2 family protein [Bacteriovorax sp.]